MPAVPITVNISANGTRAVLPVSNGTLVMGTCSSGTDTQLVSVGSTSALVSEFGTGPLVQLGAQYLSIAKAPIYCMRINDSVAATMSAVTYARVGASTGTVANNASVPNDAYNVIIESLSTGLTGTYTYRYSLDGGVTYSGTLVSAATITLGSSGINLTLADGVGPLGLSDGDLVSFTTTAPGYGPSDLNVCLTAFQNSSVRVRRIHPATTSVTSSGLYTAIRSALNTLETAYKYTMVILESDDRGAGPEAISTWQSGVLTDFATEDDRVQVIAGWCETAMVLPIGNDVLQLRRPLAWTIGPRQASVDVSEDAGAVVDGAIQNLVLSPVSVDAPTGFDLDGRLYTGFEGRGITTGQTYLGRSGIYCGGAFMRVQSTNDFYRVAHRQVMDVACETLYDVLLDYINTNVGTNGDGTILEQEAKAIESRLNAAIEAILVKVSPQRISPSSTGSYAQVDRTNIITTTEQLLVTVGLTSRPFIGSITLNIGYVLSIPVAA